jgi:acyl dehydratase
MKAKFYINVGETASFSKTLLDTDLSLFSAISGDFDPIHVDDEFAKTTPFGRRIAHGILCMAMFSTVSAMISRRARERGETGTSVSLGFDRIRFLAPVFPGDTLSATYLIERLDPQKRRSLSKVEIHNQMGLLCVVGVHVMKWLEGPAE